MKTRMRKYVDTQRHHYATTRIARPRSMKAFVNAFTLIFSSKFILVSSVTRTEFANCAAFPKSPFLMTSWNKLSFGIRKLLILSGLRLWEGLTYGKSISHYLSSCIFRKICPLTSDGQLSKKRQNYVKKNFPPTSILEYLPTKLTCAVRLTGEAEIPKLSVTTTLSLML